MFAWEGVCHQCWGGMHLTMVYALLYLLKIQVTSMVMVVLFSVHLQRKIYFPEACSKVRYWYLTPVLGSFQKHFMSNNWPSLSSRGQKMHFNESDRKNDIKNSFYYLSLFTHLSPSVLLHC